MLTATFAPAAADVARLREEVIAHGRAQAGVGTPRPVACFAHEAGRLVGAASAAPCWPRWNARRAPRAAATR